MDSPTGPPPNDDTRARTHRLVEPVEPEIIDVVDGQGGLRGVAVDHAVGAHLGVVAHPAQQPVGDSGCAPGPAGDLVGAVGGDRHAEDSGRPDDQLFQLGGA